MLKYFFRLLCLQASIGYATTITVNINTDVDQSTGGKYLSGVGMQTDLRGALNHINQTPGGNPYTVDFSLPSGSTILLNSMLPLLNLHGLMNNDITINGNLGGISPRLTIDGQNLWRGFLVSDGTNGLATLQNLIIQNVKANGGSGGGGGMGAGAGLFVDNATVTLTNVDIKTATVTGGAGGTTVAAGGGGLGGNGGTGGGGGSGGGGIGGNGGIGSQGGSGGGGINCGTGFTGAGGVGAQFAGATAGLTGGAIGAASGGGSGAGGNAPFFGAGAAGGSSGGGGGGGGAGNQPPPPATTPGGGGGGGIAGSGGSGITGGAGGYGGGGGGGTGFDPDGFGGIGGFGGGGGGGDQQTATTGGDGGFGGGGGHQSPGVRGGHGGFGGGGVGDPGTGAGTGGVGGGQGGSGSSGTGGGGAGFGGAIFVRNGSLTINGPFTTNASNNATGGAPGVLGPFSGTGGFGAGKDCFFMRTVTLLFDPKGGSIAMLNSIADDSLPSFSGASGVTLPAAGAGAAITFGTNLGGTVTFSSANTYSGGTTINSGTLALATNGALYSAGSVSINNNVITGIFDISQITLATTTIGDLSGVSGTFVGLGSKNLTLGTAASTTYAGVIRDTAIGVGVGGGITKQGSGTLTLTGANIYTGTTTISAGTIQIGNGGTTGTLGTGNVTDNSALIFNRSNTLTVGGNISGSGSVTQSGAGTTILTGTNSYGTTTISTGVLQIGNGGTTGTLGSGAVTDNTSLVFNRSNSLTVGSAIGGTGHVTQAGTGTTILTGTNTYVNTTISAGTLQVGNGGTTGTLGTGSITDNGTLAFNRSNTLTIATAITGTGNVTQSGAGTTILTGANTYVGTTISAGTLQIGNGGTTGTLGSGAVTDNSALTFNRSDSITVSNAISGTGSLTKLGAATLILTGANSYGATTISAGTLQVGNGGTTGTLGTGSVTDNSALTFNRSDTLTVVGNISGTGSVTQLGAGTTILTGTNSYGTTTISTGVLQIGNGGTTGTLGSGAVTDNTSLVFNRSNSLTVGNAIGGTGNLTQAGTGTTILTATNTYVNTTISAGTLQVGNGGTTGTLGTGSITDNGTLAFNRSDTVTISTAITGTGNLTQSGAGTTILTATNTYVGTTISAGTLQIGNGAAAGTLGSGAVTDNSALTFNRSDTITVSNAISGTGSVTKLGAATLILTGANSYGATTISAGTLQVGNGGTVGTLGTGSVTDNGALVFNRSNTLTVLGNISGTGSVTQSGAGTTILTGTNSYGTTTISAGTLQIGGGGTTGTLGTGTITDNGTLAFNRSDTVTIGTVIAGTGNLTQSGTGTTVLTATNTYVNTTISAGTLQVGNGGTTGTLGTGSITDNGILAFNRSDTVTIATAITGTGNLTQSGTGTVILTGANAYDSTTISAGILQVGSGGTTGTLGTGAVTDNTALVFNRSNTLTVVGDISGSGNLTQAGTGTTILTGTNSYGDTTISTGTLQIGSGGTTGTLGSGAVTDNAALVFNRSNSLTVASVISGSGSLTQAGTGTTILLGPNTYSGGTTVNGGTLQGNTTSLQGNIVDNAALVFDQPTDGTFAGTISGAGGSLTKTNVGKLELTGTHTYGGATNILQGNLAVNGSITSNLVTVSSGATLSGFGPIIGDTVNHGTTSPGNSIDTLTITGNYVQASGSTLSIEVSPTDSDLLSISGTATIQSNATLQIHPFPGTYLANTQYTILTSTGLTGTFDQTPSDMPTLKYVVTYDANNVYLNVNVEPFAPVVCGGNIGRVSDYLDTLHPPADSDLAFVINTLRFLDEAHLNKALAELQPAPYKNLVLAQEENVFSISRGIADRLNGLINTQCRRDAPCNQFGLWSSVFGDWASMDSRNVHNCPANEYLGYHARGGGAFLGFDYSFTNQFVLGFTGAYSYSDVHVAKSRVEGHINSIYGALYALLNNHRFYCDLALIGGYDLFHATRTINFGVVGMALVHRRAHTNHGGWDLDGHLDGGVIIDDWKALEIRPFIALDWLLLKEDGFRERGANSLNLNIRQSTNTMLRSETGVNFSKCFTVSHGKWIPEVRASAVWETFGTNDAAYRSNFVGQPGSFVAKNRNPNRALFSPSAGLRGVFYDDQMSLFLNYFGEFGNGYQNQVAKVEFSWAFSCKAPANAKKPRKWNISR